MQLVDNNSFLERLTTLFNSAKDRGSIWLTHKRLTHDGQDSTMKQEGGSLDTREYPCLLRATNGDKIEFSTRVEPGDLDKFHAAYGQLLKASFTTTLRKRDKKREKTRSEQAARRKKKMTEPIIVSGPKRGNGRRKRQRLVKAAVKQQESQKNFNEKEEARRKAAAILEHS